MGVIVHSFFSRRPASGPVANGAVSVLPARHELLSEYLRDDLTELGSLLSLRKQLEPLVDHYQPFGCRPALLLIDMDRFGEINSVYGRSVADQVLTVTAGRLKRLVPGNEATYRTGGDEFVALLESSPMIDTVGWAGQIQTALSQPVEVDCSTVAVTVSVAIVMLGYRHRVDGLLRDADVTMYRAKAEGGNRVDIYNWELDGWSRARRRDAERLEKEVEELRVQNRILADALTHDLASGMPNALAFEADHSQLEAGRQRSGDPYAIVRVCVGLGAEASAETRISVAHAVRDTVRHADRAYLLDGSDLAVLLPGSGTKHALAAAQRVRSKLEKLGAELAGGNPPFTMSIAAIEAGFRHPDTESVLRELDDLVRSAVQSGRSEIVWPH
jgi:diguanylate cyclase (GGDEF)-like protein